MCSAVGQNYRLQDIQFSSEPSALSSEQLFDIVWDRLSITAPISGASHRETPGQKFPVVIGESSHPFPFRTRKLSSLPPMVLRGKLRGRVSHCRDYFLETPLLH